MAHAARILAHHQEVHDMECAARLPFQDGAPVRIRLGCEPLRCSFGTSKAMRTELTADSIAIFPDRC